MSDHEFAENQAVFAGAQTIQFSVRFTSRKTIAISVRPDRSVVVSAPTGTELERLQATVRRRAPWIKKQQSYFAQYLPKEPPRQYVSGETHRYLGRQYRLKIVQSKDEGVRLDRPFLRVSVQSKSSERIKLLLDDWYSCRARSVFERSLVRSLERLKGAIPTKPVIGLRKMTKRWGSFTRRGTILFTPELVKAPFSCVDYVVTHELCHCVHPHHGDAFYRLLQRALPDWKERKQRLERVISAG